MRRFTTLFFTILLFFATYGQTDIFNISDSNKQINTICAKSSAGLIVNEDTLISQPNTTLNVAPSTNILYYVRSNSCPLTPSGITGPAIVCLLESFTLTAEGDSSDSTYVGKSFTLTAEGDSSDSTYVWYEGGCGSSDGGTYVGQGQGSIEIQTSIWSTGYNEGTYTFYVLISGPGGCGPTGCASKTVKVVPIPQVQISSSTNVLCKGESTGKATAGAGNGTSPYTFAWNNGQTGATATGLSAGTYSVIATDYNGCTNDQGPEEVTITQPSSVLSAGITNNTGSTILTCTRTSIPVTATATGGTGSATYKWDNHSTLASRSLTSAGTYTVTVTDANGCTASKSITITENTTPPTAGITGTSTICPGESTTLTASGGGTYNWSHSLGTGSSKSVSPTTNTTYYVTVTGSNGCTATASKTVTVLPGTPSQPSAITGTTSICPSVGTAYSVTNVTGVTYNWTYSGTGTISGSGNSISLSATTNGTLSVTASNSCGTSIARTQAITILPGTPAQPGVISGTATQCPGLTGQVYSISAVTNATTYTWIVPTGWTITAGQGSTSITVSIGTAGQNGNISITAGNSCGTSSQKTLAVTVTPNANAGTVTAGTTPQCIGQTTTYTVAGTVLGGGTGGWTSSNTSVATVNASGVVTAVGTGTCNIIYTVTGGCNGTPSNSKPYTVTPNANAGTVTAGTTPQCIGQITTYTVAGTVLGGGTGGWASSNTAVATVNSSTGLVTAVGAGTCNIIYTVTGGCNGTPTASKPYTVTPNANAGTVTAGTTPQCIGQTTTYTVAGTVLGGGTGGWTSSNTAVATVNASGVVTAVGAGTCNIIYTVTGGCNGTPSDSKPYTVTPNANAGTVTAGTTPQCIGQTTTYTVAGTVLGGGTGGWTSSNTAVATVNSSTGLVTAVGAGTCNIIYTVTGGCNGTPTASKPYTVTPNANAGTVTAGTTPQCIGQTTTYTVAGTVLGGGTGGWTSSNTSVATVNSSTGLVTAVGAGTCNIIYTVTGGCNGTPTASKPYTVTPNANAGTVTAGITPQCIGETTTFTVSGVVLGGGTGGWTSSNTSVATVNASGVVTAVGTGTCNIIYTVTGGCNGTPSNSKSYTVNPNLPVSVSITASDNPICYGLTNTFTATPTNGGTAPSYQWKLNGGDVGTNLSVYSNSTLTNGNTITCVMTSNATCATGSPATSNTITITVAIPPNTGLSNGDYVWSGNTSTNWETASNWLVYSGSAFTVASVIPNSTKNVFLRDYSPCASNIATTSVSSTVECRNITIETRLNLGGSSQLNVYGNWTNSGIFDAGAGLVNFAGSTAQTIITAGDSFYDISFNNTQNADADVILIDNMTVLNLATFTNGIVNTGSSKLIFGNSASSNGGAILSFVDGLVEKQNCTNSFTFPTGDVDPARDIGLGTEYYRIWAPFAANPASATTITVRYLFSNDGLNQWWYHDWTHEAPLTHTSDREYWLVNSGSNLQATLNWRNNDPCSIHDFCVEGPVFNSGDLTIAYWDNIWKDAGGTASSNYINGNITSLINIPFGAKGVRQITFGAKNKDMPLPVSLLSFTANCLKTSANILWQTATETNNDYFILEKSNGIDEFYEIARIKGAGNSNIIIDESTPKSKQGI